VCQKRKRLLLRSTLTLHFGETENYFDWTFSRSMSLQISVPPYTQSPFNDLTLLQKTLFTGTALNDFHSYGTWTNGCGKNFLYSNETVCILIQILKICATKLRYILYFLGKVEGSKRHLLPDWHHFGHRSDKWKTQLHG
jgi:hypothetical protein